MILEKYLFSNLFPLQGLRIIVIEPDHEQDLDGGPVVEPLVGPGVAHGVPQLHVPGLAVDEHEHPVDVFALQESAEERRSVESFHRVINAIIGQFYSSTTKEIS